MKPGNLQFYARCQYQKTLKKGWDDKGRRYSGGSYPESGLVCFGLSLGEAFFYPPR
jgi:hypothetical protein